MKAIRINEFVKVSPFTPIQVHWLTRKNYDSIQISSTPQPIPRDGEVLIKIAAAGVNYVDLLYVIPPHSPSLCNLLQETPRPPQNSQAPSPVASTKTTALSSNRPSRSASNSLAPSSPLHRHPHSNPEIAYSAALWGATRQISASPLPH